MPYTSKIFILSIIFFSLIIQDLHASPSTEACRQSVESQGYYLKPEGFFQEVLGLDDRDVSTLTKILSDQDRVDHISNDEDAHYNETYFKTCITAVNTPSENIFSFSCDKIIRNEDVINAGGKFSLHTVLQQYHGAGIDPLSDTEKNIFEKMALAILGITLKKSVVITVSLYSNSDKNMARLPLHQDYWPTQWRSPDYLGFGILHYDASACDLHLEGSHPTAYQQIGLANRDLLTDILCADCSKPDDHNKEAINIYKIIKQKDHQGSGYVINQQFTDKANHMIIHGRTVREACKAIRQSAILRIKILDDENPNLFQKESINHNGARYKDVNLSDPLIARALCENYLRKNRGDLSLLDSIRGSSDAPDYADHLYASMPR